MWRSDILPNTSMRCWWKEELELLFFKSFYNTFTPNEHSAHVADIWFGWRSRSRMRSHQSTCLWPKYLRPLKWVYYTCRGNFPRKFQIQEKSNWQCLCPCRFLRGFAWIIIRGHVDTLVCCWRSMPWHFRPDCSEEICGGVQASIVSISNEKYHISFKPKRGNFPGSTHESTNNTNTTWR